MNSLFIKLYLIDHAVQLRRKMKITRKRKYTTSILREKIRTDANGGDIVWETVEEVLA
jgi:hypothetical protein